MTVPAQRPPDGRLDGAVHLWFSLSYSNYLVLPRTLMQSMPTDWQDRMVACLRELDDAFDHIRQADYYQVTPAREVEYGDLTDAQMAQIGAARCTPDDHPPGTPDAVGCPHFYDEATREHEAWHRALVPCGGDPVPHYDRGRAYIEPRLSTGDQPHA